MCLTGKWRATKRIFQIAYDEQLGPRRADLLRVTRLLGVISVIGNDPARVLLTSIQPLRPSLFAGHGRTGNKPEQKWLIG